MRLQVLRDQQKKLELAGRMYRLWEESGHPQKVVAAYIGLEHRSYQKALQTGGISYEKLTKLAEFHDVDINWLLKGDPEEEQETPDLMAAVSGGNGQTEELREQLLALDAKLDLILHVLRDDLPKSLTAAVEEVLPKPPRRSTSAGKASAS